MKKLLARWFFALAVFNIWIASLIEETETAVMLVWLFRYMMKAKPK